MTNRSQEAIRNSARTAGGAAAVLVVMLFMRGQIESNYDAPMSADQRVTDCAPDGLQPFEFRDGQGVGHVLAKIEGPVEDGAECHTEAVTDIQRLIDDAVGGNSQYAQPTHPIDVPKSYVPRG